MIQKKVKDKKKAISLIESSDIKYMRLKEISTYKFPTDSLVDYYSIIHSLCEAIISLEGFKIRGEGAHKELIDYVLKDYELKQFVQEMRELRNQAQYEGKQIKADYLKINENEINKIIKFLKQRSTSLTKKIK